MTDIQTFESAFRHTLDYLTKKRHYPLRNVGSTNRGRYGYIFSLDYLHDNYIFMFKRQLYISFGSTFKRFGYSGIGDSINERHLFEARSKGINKLLTMLPDGNLYELDLKTLQDNSVRHKNKEGVWIFSFSVHLYKRFDVIYSEQK